MSISAELSSKIGNLPHKPGVYLMKDRFGTVIYVGKARDLRRRVSQYFQTSRRLGWDPKLKALVEAIRDLEVHVVRGEPEAILLEGRLIKDFRPRYNISFRDDKRFLLLKVNFNDPIPRFTLTRIRTEDGARYFGPYANSGALRRTLNLVRHRFNLRGCRVLTPGEQDYKHCLYAHLKVCTAPCIGNVTREQYLMQVYAACDFLDGQYAEMKQQLEQRMQTAARELDFEKAAELRDLLTDLERTTRKTTSFARLPYSLPVTLDPKRDLAELGKTLGLTEPPARIEGFDISNISGTFAVASMVVFRNGRPDRSGYRRFRIKTVTGQDDCACIAEAVRRRYLRLVKELGARAVTPSTAPDSSPAPVEGKHGWPDLIVIDGGKGQLNAACGQLAKLGLGDLPVIGLAKEFEEIHRPGRKDPLQLRHDCGALQLLQRVRDESHRFANTYNAQLRLKRISESLLDEFPSIGTQRKAALLKRFGSVHRLRLATQEEIASVPGFGGKAAIELKAFLEARRDRTRAQPSAGSPV